MSKLVYSVEKLTVCKALIEKSLEREKEIGLAVDLNDLGTIAFLDSLLQKTSEVTSKNRISSMVELLGYRHRLEEAFRRRGIISVCEEPSD